MTQPRRRASLWWAAAFVLLGAAAMVLALPHVHAQAAAGGPDAAGYSWKDNTAAGGPAWSFVNIAGNGTQLSPALGDDTQTTLTLPFSFTWYDITTTQVKVSSNGYMCFDAAAANSCGAIYAQPPPGSAVPNDFVAAYNKDLNCLSQPTCAYSTSWGAAGSQVFVVMLNGEGCYGTTGCSFTFEYKVFQATGCVEVHYSTMTDMNSNQAFAGTEGKYLAAQYTGLTYYLGGAGGPALSNKAVRYCPGSPIPGAPPVPCPTPGPQNDCFANATPVGSVPYSSTEDTGLASMESGEPVACCSEGKSVWFSWTPGYAGTASADTCPSGYAVDTVLAVYTGNSLSTLNLIAANDQGATCAPWSQISFTCVPGTTYRFQIGTYANSPGGPMTFQLSGCGPVCLSGPPANDCFANATPVAANSYSTTQSTTGALMETGEPSPCCSIGKSVWYSWTPSNSGTATVDTCGVTAVDTVLAAYTGSAVNALTLLTYNDQACGNQSSITFACTAGTTYRIQVSSYFNGAGGNIAMNMVCSPPCTIPANDCFASAIPVSANSYTNTQSTSGAAMETGEPTPCCGIGKSVWYSWTPTVSGTATADTCGVTAVNTVLAAYTGNAVNALSTVAYNDNSCGSQSIIGFPCVAGTTYAIQVSSSFNGAAGNVILNLNCSPACTLPANDCFASATPVTTNTYTTSQSTYGASMEGGEPTPSCCFQIQHSVWFSWTPTVTGSALVNTCGSNFDTALAAYTGNAVNALSEVASNNNYCSTQSQITFPCVAGTTYRIQASSYYTAPFGNLQLSMGCTVPLPPKCGYTTDNAAPYNWTEISPAMSGGGTGVPGGQYTAMAVHPTTPFNFNFCGATYQTFWLSSEGVVCMGANTFATGTMWSSGNPSHPLGCASYSGQTPLPNGNNNPNAAIYGYWTDLNPNTCSGGPSACKFYKVVGTAPDRVLIYEEKNVPIYYSNFPGETFEVKLYESSGCIEVDYQQVQPSVPYYAIVAGYESAYPVVGYQYAYYPAYSSPGFTRTNQAWRACPPIPAVDDPYTINEDAAAATYPVLANDPSGSWVMSVSGATLGTATVTPGGGSITYVPAADANGLDTITYTVTNSGGATGTALANITVRPVNDAPAFTDGPTLIEAGQGAGMQTYPGWATDVAPAQGLVASPVRALDEGGQDMAFTVTTSNAGLFAVAPTLDRTVSASSTSPNPASGTFGMLRFRPSATVSGAADVCITAHDDGGTTNGGVDQSAPHCIDIVVNPCAAGDDAYNAYRYWTLHRNAPGITLNDAGTPMYPITVLTPVAHGTMDLDTESGRFDYHPDDDFTGVDQLQYTVRCGNAESRVATVNITVSVNTPPTAYFQESTGSAAPGQGVTFDSCPEAIPLCSYDPDAWDAIEYDWEFGDGTTGHDANPSHVYAAPGTYQVRLVVRDSVGNTSAYERTVVVAFPGAADVSGEDGGILPPIADAGGNRTVASGILVKLLGSQRGGTEATTFQWAQVRGETVVLANATTATPSFTAPLAPDGRPATLVFTLQVTDGARVSRADFAMIHVVDADEAPVADAGAPFTVLVGQAEALDGSASRSPTGKPLTYAWEQVMNPGDIVVQLSGADSARPTFTAPVRPGQLEFRLTVSDGTKWSQADAVVVVQAPPAKAAPPRFLVTLEPAAPGAVARFTAAGGEPDAVWDFGDGLASMTGASVTHHYAPGTYNATITVGLGSQRQSTSQQVEVPALAVQGEPAAAAGTPWMAVVLGGVGLLALAAVAVVLATRLVRRRRQAERP